MALLGSHHHGDVVHLRDSALTVANRADDLRGRHVVDRHDGEIGWIDDLVLTSGTDEVTYLDVRHGWFFGIWAPHKLIPVDEIVEIDDETVHVDLTAGEHPPTPCYHPALVQRPGPGGERHGLRRVTPL